MKKYIVYLLGLLCLGLGITLNTKSGLGVASFSTLPYSLSHLTFLSFGQANILIYLLLVLLQILIERKITMNIILEIPFSFVFGFVIDMYQILIPTLTDSLIIQIVALVVGNTCCAIGVYMMIQTNLVVTPVDGFVGTLSHVLKKPYSLCKNLFDLSMITVTCFVCLCTFSPFYGIGVGTVFSALYVGRMIKMCESHICLCFS